MKVLLLDNYDSFTYNLAQILTESGLCSFDIIKNDKIKINDLKKYNKILLSPGPGIPLEAGKMMKIIEKYYISMSILGVCLGHEAICEFFGAKLINLNQIFHGIATKIIITDPNESLFKGVPKKINGGRYHSWAVDKNSLPSCLQVTALTDDSSKTIMAVTHKDYDIKGLQFHPESIMTEFGKMIIHNWLK